MKSGLADPVESFIVAQRVKLARDGENPDLVAWVPDSCQLFLSAKYLAVARNSSASGPNIIRAERAW